MSVPTIPHLVLLFFLGGAFLHFIFAGARTLQFKPGEAGLAAAIAQGMFMFGGVVPTWFVGLYQPIHRVNGLVAACLLVVSLALYEWARSAIWGRRFGVAWGDHVPDEVCEHGPYRYVRHPLYLSYVLAYLAVVVALPHWLTASLLVANVVLWPIAARSDERRIAESPLAAPYAEYRKRVGMMFPRFS